jgi:hypothetical protein
MFVQNRKCPPESCLIDGPGFGAANPELSHRDLEEIAARGRRHGHRGQVGGQAPSEVDAAL